MTRMTDRAKSNRRAFLKGQAAVDAILDLAQRVPAEDDAFRWSADGPASVLLHLSRRAMACNFEFFFNDRQYDHAGETAMAALDLVEELEAQMTIYRDDSELSHVNRTASDEPQVVEARLFDLLRIAVGLSRETDGAFDITSGPLSKVWGFSRRQGRIPADEELAAALARTGSAYVRLNSAHQTVQFAREGVELNLGSIGKGYALDRCAELLKEGGIDDFLLHGGGSSVLAAGSRSDAEGETNGWLVGIRHPMRPERRIAEVRLENRALGTSGSGVQFFRHQGRRYGHILDPRTGQPAEGVHSATVVASTAAMADALATAFYTMGPEKAVDFCSQRPELGMIMVLPGRRTTDVEIRTCGLAKNEIELLDD